MRWKWLLQQATGGVRRVPGAAARLLNGGYSSELSSSGKGCRLGITSEDLQGLLSGEAPVVICRGALSPDFCKRAADRLRAVEDVALPKPGEQRGSSAALVFSEWRLGADPEAPASDYAKLGYTKTDVLIQEGLRMAAGKAAPESYLKRAAESRSFLDSEVFAPLRSPIDDIQEELSALPGVRCRLERCPVSKRDFLPCVVRRMSPGGRRQDGNVHMDTVVPGSTFSINVYLSVPPGTEGGELVLWPVRKGSLDRFLNAHFFETIEVQNFYPQHTFYTHDLLASGRTEPIVYRPAAGDVVLIDPAYPHAVRDFEGPADLRRISLQTFVQVSRRGSGSGAGASDVQLEYAV